MNLLNLFTKKTYLARNFVGTKPEVDKWIISEFITNIIIPIVGLRPYPLSELELLVSTLVYYRPTHICDWGTHFGKATRIFYETVKAFNLKTKIISVDLPETVEHVEHPHKERGKFVQGLPVKLLLGDGVIDSIRYLKKYSQKNIRPMFFLDGDHSYKSVKRELAIIYRTYPRSAIIIHDTFYQSDNSGYNTGPFQAINEFVLSHPQYLQFSTVFGLPGMTALLPQYAK